MVCQDLATVKEYDIPVVVCVLDNRYLGMVAQWQKLFYEERISHTKLGEVPDFVKLAEAYGAVGLRASKPDEVEALIKKGLSTPKTVIMEFIVEGEEGVYPMVPSGAPINKMILL